MIYNIKLYNSFEYWIQYDPMIYIIHIRKRSKTGNYMSYKSNLALTLDGFKF